MLWCDCLRVFSCGLFGIPESSTSELSPIRPQTRAEVKYTFAIEDSSSSEEEAPSPESSDRSSEEEASSSERSDRSSDCSDFVSPGSDSSSGSPWEVLDDQ